MKRLKITPKSAFWGPARIRSSKAAYHGASITPTDRNITRIETSTEGLWRTRQEKKKNAKEWAKKKIQEELHKDKKKNEKKNLQFF